MQIFYIKVQPYMYKIKNNDVLAKSMNVQVIKTNIISYQKEKD